MAEGLSRVSSLCRWDYVSTFRGDRVPERDTEPAATISQTPLARKRRRSDRPRVRPIFGSRRPLERAGETPAREAAKETPLVAQTVAARRARSAYTTSRLHTLSPLPIQATKRPSNSERANPCTLTEGVPGAPHDGGYDGECGFWKNGANPHGYAEPSTSRTANSPRHPSRRRPAALWRAPPLDPNAALRTYAAMRDEPIADAKSPCKCHSSARFVGGRFCT